MKNHVCANSADQNLVHVAESLNSFDPGQSKMPFWLRKAPEISGNPNVVGLNNYPLKVYGLS